MRISDLTMFRASFVRGVFSQISQCLMCPLSFSTLFTLSIFIAIEYDLGPSQNRRIRRDICSSVLGSVKLYPTLKITSAA
jgi:hypothetical protein